MWQVALRLLNDGLQSHWAMAKKMGFAPGSSQGLRAQLHPVGSAASPKGFLPCGSLGGSFCLGSYSGRVLGHYKVPSFRTGRGPRTCWDDSRGCWPM